MCIRDSHSPRGVEAASSLEPLRLQTRNRCRRGGGSVQRQQHPPDGRLHHGLYDTHRVIHAAGFSSQSNFYIGAIKDCCRTACNSPTAEKEAQINERSTIDHRRTKANGPGARVADAQANGIWEHWLQLRSATVSTSCHAASALRTLGAGFETTNRKEGRRLLGRAALVAAARALNAARFIAAT